MAAELEKLAKQFKTSGNKDIAKGLSAWAQVAKSRGLDTFQTPTSSIVETTPTLPEGAIRLPEISVTGMNNGEMEELADSTKNLNVGSWARDVIKRAPTASLEEPQVQDLATLDVRTMGLRADYPTTQQIWEKAKKFGDRVSVETMVKLAAEAAKGNIQVEIGKPLVGVMEPVTDSFGNPDVLYVARDEDGLWLNANSAYSDSRWLPDNQFVVSPRK